MLHSLNGLYFFQYFLVRFCRITARSFFLILVTWGAPEQSPQGCMFLLSIIAWTRCHVCNHSKWLFWSRTYAMTVLNVKSATRIFLTVNLLLPQIPASFHARSRHKFFWWQCSALSSLLLPASLSQSTLAPVFIIFFFPADFVSSADRF